MPGLHAVTGGPGSGKTTLLDHLSRRGFPVSAEAGRGVILQQNEIGGYAHHQGDRTRFAELMLSWEMRSYRLALDRGGTTFFDRGVSDIIGYRRLVGLPVPAHLVAAARICRYDEPVFAAPHWPEIYITDAERRQDEAEAEATFHAVTAAWRECGYRIVVLPKATPEERLDFVLRHIG